MCKRETLEAKAEKARIKLGLTPAELKMIQHAADAVYQEIAYDLTPDHQPKGGIGYCRRSTIIEVVLDAGRLWDMFLALRAGGLTSAVNAPIPPMAKQSLIITTRCTMIA